MIKITYDDLPNQYNNLFCLLFDKKDLQGIHLPMLMYNCVSCNLLCAMYIVKDLAGKTNTTLHTVKLVSTFVLLIFLNFLNSFNSRS